MILSNEIINDIKAKSGLVLDKTKDMEILSSYIFKETNRNIGTTTLKRLFGIINDDRRSSDFTLNTIAMYLGFMSWDEYVNTKNINSIWRYDDDTVYIQKLDIGTKLRIRYLNRVVTLEVICVENIHVLKVIEAENSSLLTDDILYIHCIRKGEVLIAEKVVRGKNIGNYKTNGEIQRIEFL
ncbi:MAG: hypothetical protein LUD48_02495 [Prevotella sp.]|nr:hypothetical protein [Prevotella sp.]